MPLKMPLTFAGMSAVVFVFSHKRALNTMLSHAIALEDYGYHSDQLLLAGSVTEKDSGALSFLTLLL